MGKALCLVWAFCLAANATLHAGNTEQPDPHITMSGTHTLRHIFDVIGKQTGKHVSYATAILNEKEKINIKVTKATVDEVLTLVLKGKNISWVSSAEYITLFRTNEPPTTTDPATQRDTVPLATVSGRVTDSAGAPLAGASVQVRGSAKGVATDGNGDFTLSGVKPGATLTIGFTGYQPVTMPLAGRTSLRVALQQTITELKGVAVYATGYQNLPKERATGSFVQVDNELYNRKVGASVLDRLDGVTSGLVFNKNLTSQYGQSSISIRGRSTILGNAEPLIVVDNFPYTGDINSLNPNDIESVTVLRDAAAASIWGTRAGNGVIVITTKKGKAGQRPAIAFNTNVTYAEKPNLFYTPQMSNADYVEAERFLFNKGAYNTYLQFLPYYYSSPVIDVLWQQKRNLITEAQANEKIQNITRYDIRNDLEKYVYRNSINQQYALSISGGNLWNQYYYSVGYDRGRGTLKNSNTDRISFTGRNTFVVVKDRVEINTGIIYAKAKTAASSTPMIKTPYGRLQDETGNKLVSPGNYRQAYIDTAGGGKLLDWNYRPLQELEETKFKTDISDLLATVGLKVNIIKGLNAQVLYQYGKGTTEATNFYSTNSYYTRNLINSFSQYNSTGGVAYAIPKGAIFDRAFTQYESNSLRGQLNFNRTYGNHNINALGGVERRTYRSLFIPDPRLYGYNPELQSFSNTDFQKLYPQFYSASSQFFIPGSSYGVLRQERRDNNLSYFINAAYNYNDRYTISASLRKDESNIFGVNTNQKGVPLYSLGASWNISNENFYKITWLPYLKARATYGYNGNVDRSTAAYLTASAGSSPNIFNQQYFSIANPPNPELRWEKIRIINVGLDFGSINNRVSGSFECFAKKGNDMIGDGTLPPSSGVTQFRGNTADIKGHGFDLVLNTVNINQPFKWTTNFLLSYAMDRITKYKVKASLVNDYIRVSGFHPIEGKPVHSILSYPWGGLETNTGDPIGLLDGKPSKDYTKIIGTNDINTLIYNGPANPTHFGSIRNNFIYKNIELSLNITGKFGYYFRRPSVNYSTMQNNTLPISYYNPDYNKRWMKPGDEVRTSVPSQVYPAPSGRSEIYAYSEILVEKGDHIRLQDIQASYTFAKGFNRIGIKSLRVYGYVNNVGILWRANKYKIDPDVVPSNLLVYPNPRSYALGVNVGF